MRSDVSGQAQGPGLEPSFSLRYAVQAMTEVYSGRQLLARAGTLIRSLPGGAPRHAIIGIDENVHALYGRVLEDSCRTAGLEPFVVRLRPGEAEKTLANVGRALGDLARHGVERHDVLVAVGGGVSGDLFGFVAASYMRGMRLVQVPTTLLAQVDSSIGGKVGVDLPEGKNLVGAFKQPDSVIIDYDVLGTLPYEEWVSGTAEVAKHGVIGDAALFRALEAAPDAWRQRTVDIGPILAAAIRVKARVVQEDEREAGVRMHLNYGHTLGHALEAAAGYGTVRHGEGVAWGMAAEARMAAALGLSNAAFVRRQDRLLLGLGLLKPLPDLDGTHVYQLLFLDKKVKSGRVRWILPECEPGSVIVRDDVPEELVRDLIEATVTGRLLGT